MQYLYPILIGLLTGTAGSALPGILNMNVVKTAERQGEREGYFFIAGACLLILIQILIAGYVVGRLGFTEKMTEILRIAGLIIFVILTLYFFFFASKLEAKRELKNLQRPMGKHGSFLRGILLAMANLFPLPFYLMLFALIKSYHIEITLPYTLLTSGGVLIGTAFIFTLYMKLFKRYADRVKLVTQNINLVIGVLTGLVGIGTAIKIFFS